MIKRWVDILIDFGIITVPTKQEKYEESRKEWRKQFPPKDINNDSR
jgi:hypothetical protein